MNNEPVAWMVENDEDISFIMNGNGFDKPDASWKSVIPVYTHPAKESKAKDRFPSYESICLQCGTTIYKPALKTLTDEEIAKEAEKDKYWDYEDFDFMKFARAILRKAQEK
jgi:hypothetical protein